MVYQILDYQAANPGAVKAKSETEAKPKPEAKQDKPQQKRARVQKKPEDNKDQKSLEFSVWDFLRSEMRISEVRMNNGYIEITNPQNNNKNG